MTKHVSVRCWLDRVIVVFINPNEIAERIGIRLFAVIKLALGKQLVRKRPINRIWRAG